MATVQIAYLAFDVPGLQYARPIADVSLGSWHREPVPDVNFYDVLDEVTASDTDYIYSDATPVDDRIEFQLSEIDQPVNRTVTLYLRGSFG